VASQTIWTVGHGARPLEEFVAILRSAGIRRVVDVRTAPGSRKHPQFGKDALTEGLRAAGIEYLWRKDLGGWRKPRPDSEHTALRSAAFRGYADHMESRSFDDAVRWLIETAAEGPTAAMCAESLWWRCHRRMLADALLARGCEVIHLTGRGQGDTHRLHSAARLLGTRVIYDQEDPEQQRLA
jgi:uncharacterized protein (DUF488 family)